MKDPRRTGRPRFGWSENPRWQPDAERQGRSRLLRAMASWGVGSLEDLQDRAIADPEWYWRAVVRDLGVNFGQDFTVVCDDSRGKPLSSWFVGGRINAATHCASRHVDAGLGAKRAVVYEGDGGQSRSLTYAALDSQIKDFAANLIGIGVRKGDRVVIFMPVVPEVVVAFLACAHIGAVSVPAFTGYGSEALAARLRDSEAVALVTADGTTRRGKFIPLKATADAALADVPSVRRVVVFDHQGQTVPMEPDRDVYWHELDPAPSPVDAADLDSNEPLAILYTSGTSGAPKGIVLSHAGFLVKAGHDFAYGFDVHEDDVLAWIADMGWMLGPLLILGVLQLGATLVLTEGVPTFPSNRRLWDIAERNGVTIQGIAPTAARAVMAVSDGDYAGLDTIHTFASTGEAWDEPTWEWLFDSVGGGTRPVINYSGGTETGGGILIAYPFLPMDPASFNGPLVGMDVSVLSQDGEFVRDAIGELAVLNAWPGMTHSFWQDDERYLNTYWSRWTGVWDHGDLASISKDGVWRVHGRSDDTIKVSGRRVGPAEIEAALLKDRRIVEAAAIGVPDLQRGQRIVAFVVAPDLAESEFSDLQRTAEYNVGRSFAPILHVVRTLPKTKNGKVMRRVIKARHLSLPLGNLVALDPTTPVEDIPINPEKESSNDAGQH